MSWFRCAANPSPGGEIDLRELASKVRTSPTLAERTKFLRALLDAGDRERYDAAKRELPAVTPAGRFERRASSGLLEHSGLVVVDLDGLPDLAAAEAARDAAAASPHVALAFVSPSGLGAKAVVRVELAGGGDITAATHPAVWAAAAAHVKELTGHEADPTGRDVARLCFLSLDPEARYRADAEPLPVDPPAPQDHEPTEPSSEFARPPSDVIGCGECYLATAWPAARADVRASLEGKKWDTLRRVCDHVGRSLVGPALLGKDTAVRELVGQIRERCEDVGAAERTARQAIEHGAKNPRPLADPPRCRLHGPSRDADLPTTNAARQAECDRRDADEREALRRPAVRPVTRCLADVKPERVAWLWPGRIPLGKLTLLAGHPGLGKSCMTMAVAATVTRGAPWPAGEGHAPSGGVVILSAEDGAADTIRPRLDAAGGDPARVTLLEAVREGDRERGLDLGRDVEALAALLAELGNVRLLIIDPISAYLGKSDDNSNGEIRGLLAPVARLAEQHGCAVLLVSHFRKGQAGAALMRAIGTVGLIAACRAAWGMTKDPDNPGGRLLLPLKSNLAAEPPGIRFGLVEPPGHAAPAIAWGELIHGADVDRLLGSDPDREQRGERNSPAADEALAWLADSLADGPVPASELRKRAKLNETASR